MHRIVSFIPGLVERIERLQKKGALRGKLVFVRGKKRTRTYKEANETKDRLITEIIIDMNGVFIPLERVSDANGGDDNAGVNTGAPAPLPDQDDAMPPSVDEQSAAAL